MTEVSAVVFDVDGTLYDTRRMRWGLLPRLLKGSLMRPTEATTVLSVIRSYRRVHEQLRGRGRDELGGALADVQLRLTAELSGEREQEVRRIVHECFDVAPLPALAAAARPGLSESLARLRGAGLRTAVLSDYPPIPKLRALGVEAMFDCVAWAQEASIGVLKPDPAGLREVLRRLGVAPERAVYVGDRPEVDAIAAASAGCRGVLIGGKGSPDGRIPVFTELPPLTDWILDGARAPAEG